MTKRLAFILTAAVLLAGAATPADAQKYEFVGRAKCVNCHDHDNEKLWSEKKDGPPPNNHLNALKQMETEKSTAFAAATGVKDVYDVGSPCVRCHATVVKGDVSGGVTCETCHGAGSGYLEPHQKKDAYPQAVATGLVDTVKKSNNWAVTCMTCHVMDDVRLIAAKHPSGEDFDLGAKFTVVATGHWKSTYDKAAITALGKAAAAKILAARKGGTAPAAPPPVSSAAPAPASAPPVSAPAVTAAAPAPVAPATAAPAAAPVAPPTATAAAPPPRTTTQAPGAAAPPAPTSAAQPTPGSSQLSPAPVQNAAGPAAVPPATPPGATVPPTADSAASSPTSIPTPPPSSTLPGTSVTTPDTSAPPVGTQVLVESSISWWAWVVIPLVVAVIGGIWYFTQRRSGK